MAGCWLRCVRVWPEPSCGSHPPGTQQSQLASPGGSLCLNPNHHYDDDGNKGRIQRCQKKKKKKKSRMLRCGRCGRSMQVGYSGSTGKIGRYLCGGRRQQRGSGPCLQIGSLKLDQAVSEQALEAYLLQSNLATGSARWLFLAGTLAKVSAACRCCEAEILTGARFSRARFPPPAGMSQQIIGLFT